MICFILFFLLFAKLCAMDSPIAPYNEEDFRRLKAGEKNLVKANLQGIELDAFDLSGVDFTDANLNGAKLNYVNCNKAKFVRTTLRYAEISSTQCDDVLFDHADLSHDVLNIFSKRAHFINNTTFYGAHFSRGVFSDSVLNIVEDKTSHKI